MPSLARRVFHSDVFRHGTLVLVATTLGNIAAFGYHAVVSRHLGVGRYGSLYALISFASLVTLPVGFFPTVVARYAAEFHSLGDGAHSRALARFVARVFGGVALALVLLLSACASPLGAFLRVPAWEIIPTAILAAIIMFSPMIRAILQGDQDFAFFSWSSASEGFGKVLFGGVFAAADFGIVGALAGFAAGGLCGIALSSWRLLRRFGALPKIAFRIDWRRVTQTSFGAVAATVATAVLTSSDVVLVKHFFSSHDAGLYAAASLGGKIMLFGVGFAPTILLPKATLRHARGERTRGALLGAAVMLAGVGVIGLACFGFGGSLILRALVGSAFGAAAPLLVWYGLAMTLLAGTNLLVSYALALHRLSFAWPLIAAALAEPLGIALFHPSLFGVISVVIASNLLALSFTGAALYVDSRRLWEAKSAM
jgi:O-antigen/teichoic acid export membrane protein